MALAKDGAPLCSFYGSYMLEGVSPSPLHLPSPSSNPSSTFYPFEEDHCQKQLSLQEEDSDGQSANHNVGNAHRVQDPLSHSPPLSSSSSATSSNGFAFHGGIPSYHQPEEAYSVINFNRAVTTTTAIASYVGGFMHTHGPLLSFQSQNCYSFGQPNDQYPSWEGSSPHRDHHHQNQLKMKSAVGGGDFRVFEEANCLQTTSRGGYHHATREWLYGEGAAVARESATLQQEQTSFNKKRALMNEENMQILKKQCNSSRKQPNKPKPSNSAKDPQSMAAKNRRERISERLKILQDLVPYGSKVDLVTMLEKAISYVKFLQLQV